MSRVAYVDGQFVLHRSAAFHIEHRGDQFGDCRLRDCCLAHTAGAA